MNLVLLSVFGIAGMFPSENAFLPTVHERIVQELADFKERNRVTSVSFALFKGDEGGFEYASGYADVEQEIPATPDHFYTLASVTKSITAMTVLDLVRQNLLSLSDPVAKFIPRFPPDITVLDLLNHTSGLRRENETEAYLNGSSYQKVVDYLPTGRVRNKKFSYANINYAAIGTLIEHITQRPFSAVAADYFRRVTGEELYFSNHPRLDGNPLFVKNYVRRGRRHHQHNLVDFGLWEPVAFAQASPRALARFLRHHMTPEFVAQLESMAVESRSYKLDGGRVARNSYALGFRLSYIDGRLHCIYHNGFIYGVISTICYLPHKDVGMVIVSNMSTFPSQSLNLFSLHETVERVLDEDFNMRIARYVAQFGYQSGIVYYQANRNQGQLLEEVICEYGRELLHGGRRSEAMNLYRFNRVVFPDSNRMHDMMLATGEGEDPRRIEINIHSDTEEEISVGGGK